MCGFMGSGVVGVWVGGRRVWFEGSVDGEISDGRCKRNIGSS